MGILITVGMALISISSFFLGFMFGNARIKKPYRGYIINKSNKNRKKCISH